MEVEIKAKNEVRYDRLLQNLKMEEPRQNLKEAIMLRISAYDKKMEKVRIFIYGGSTATSLGLSIWASVSLFRGLSQTGFFQYFSLLFSENGALISYWKEFSYTLIESLPILGLIIFLAAVGALIWSSANVLRNFGNSVWNHGNQKRSNFISG